MMGDKTAARSQRGVAARAMEVFADYGVVAFLAALVVAFSIALPNLFPTWANIQSVLNNQAVPGVLALAILLPLSVGEFDLSLASVLGFVSIFSAWATMDSRLPLAVVIPCSLLIGVAVGALNAFLIIKVRMSALIATLGTGTILTGGNLWLSNGAVIFGLDEGLMTFARVKVLGLPLTFYYLVIAAFVLWYLLELTPYGRYLQATGLGRVAARLGGVRTNRYMASAFVLAGLIAAFAGLMQTGRVGSASPTVGGSFMLPAFAAAFLGATTIKRGRFNVWGTMTGVLVLAVGTSGLALMGAPFWVSDVFNGAALLAAVAFAVLVGRRGQADHV